MSVMQRYLLAFMGGFLAMSAHVYLLYGRGNWLSPQRLNNTIGAALIFAHILALMILLARDFASKSSTVRLFIRLIGGLFLGTLTWLAHVFLFLFQTSFDMPTLLLGGLGLASGFIVIGYLPIPSPKIRFLSAILIATITTYIPILLTYQNYLQNPSAQALLYFQADNPNDVWLIGLPFAVTIAIISNIPVLFSSSPIVKP